ncbi:MAG: RNA-dependent DNA polymerase, partial [bacterium]|nr:RNA-dependent DNA polymerase [bacterium]
VRYVDDLALFADDKRTLWAWRAALVERLAGLRLTIHPGAQPRPVTEGLPFLGFVVYPTHRRLKRRNVVKFRRRLRGLLAAYEAGEAPLEHVTASIQGWINHARYGDTWGLRRAVLQDVVL